MNDETATPAITCKPGGPYIVNGLSDLKDARGNSVQCKPTIALCRCGGSAKKPFCDGTHARNGFTDAKQADRTADHRETYVGKNITIHDNRAICAHAGICTDNLASVWRMHDEPWIDPDGAAAAAIIAVIARCPSGALSYATADADVPAEDTAPAVRALPDGPYEVTGPIALNDQGWGDGAKRDHYTLCRCGASKNKPFCDGSHWQAGFKDGGPLD